MKMVDTEETHASEREFISDVQIAQPVIRTVFVFALALCTAFFLMFILGFLNLLTSLPPITLTVFFLLAIIVIFIYMLQSNDKSITTPNGEFGIVKSLKVWFLIYGPVVTFVFVLGSFISLLTQNPTQSVYDGLTGSSLDLIIIIILTVIFLGPIAEELLFRKYLLPELEKLTSDRHALILSSLVFSMMHWFADFFGGTVDYAISHMFGTFFLGLLFGYIYQKTRNITFPMIIHGVNNAVSFMPNLVVSLFPFTQAELDAYKQGVDLASNIRDSIIAYSVVNWVLFIFTVISCIAAIYIIYQNSDDMKVYYRGLLDVLLSLKDEKYLFSVMFALFGIVLVPALFAIIALVVGGGSATPLVLQLVGYGVVAFIALYILDDNKSP